MKKLLLPAILTLIGIHTVTAQVGIGTETPDASAQLELQSTTKGFLPPRMKTKNRDDIENPVEGLTIYNTDVRCLQWYVGKGAWHNSCGDNVYLQYPKGTVFGESGPALIVEVTNASTGKTWMDRNLGALQAASKSDDELAYGDLYQWGRGPDGHQLRESKVYNGDVEGFPSNAVDSGAWNALLILTNKSPYDWLGTNKNDFLWNTHKPDNRDGLTPFKWKTDPCPLGFRLPSEAEWDRERQSWIQEPIQSTNDASGAYATPLKLPIAGRRNAIDGSLASRGLGGGGYYWSSTVSSESALLMCFIYVDAVIGISQRAEAYSIRCI